MKHIRDDPVTKAVVQELARVWGERLVAVVVSGSWSRGEATEHSDIDLDCVISDGSFHELAFSLGDRVYDIAGGTEADWTRAATTPRRVWVVGDWPTWGDVTLHGDAAVGARIRAAIAAVPQERFDAAAVELLPELITYANKVASAVERGEPAAARWAAGETANSAAAIVGLINRRQTGKPWGRHLAELLADAGAPPSFAETYAALTAGAGADLVVPARALAETVAGWLSARGLSVPVVDDLEAAVDFIEATVP